MLKYVLLATTMCIASPALAQETPTPDTSQQDRTTVTEPVTPAEPATPAPETQAIPAADPAPAAETATAQPVPAEPAQPAEAVAATPAPATQPATTQDQVAQVVNSEFATYDKNGDGSLDEAEFGAWMVTLRKAAQPEFVADSAEGKAWVTAAFLQADADKSKTVDAAELTGFLTPKPAA